MGDWELVGYVWLVGFLMTLLAVIAGARMWTVATLAVTFGLLCWLSFGWAVFN